MTLKDENSGEFEAHNQGNTRCIQDGSALDTVLTGSTLSRRDVLVYIFLVAPLLANLQHTIPK